MVQFNPTIMDVKGLKGAIKLSTINGFLLLARRKFKEINMKGLGFYVRRQIFEGKLSVLPYFLHHFLDNNGATVILKDKLYLKTLGVYISIIF